ncbi:MAG: hypothetical protein GX630_07560, partial [Actinobacteria bacterium]|nr:hypothetical protein [Actinomycetota bacterium]
MGRIGFVLRERMGQVREWLDKRSPRRFRLALLACLLVGLTVIIGTEYLPTLRGFSEGKPAPRSVSADETVTVLDIAATEELKSFVGGLVEPVYTPDPGALAEATTDLVTFLQKIEQARPDILAGADLDEAMARISAAAPATASDETLRYLLTTGSRTYTMVKDQSLGALQTLYAGRITEGSLNTTLLTLRSIADALAVSTATADAVYELTAAYVRPNQTIDEEQTEVRRRAAMEQVAPVVLTVARSTLVVGASETVTDQDLLILDALGLTESRSGWKVWLGIFLLMALETLIFSQLLRRLNKTVEEFRNNMWLVLTVLLLGFTLLARLLVIEPLSAYLIPAASLGMVVT